MPFLFVRKIHVGCFLFFVFFLIFIFSSYSYKMVRACKWVDQLVTEVPYSFDTQEQLQE